MQMKKTSALRFADPLNHEQVALAENMLGRPITPLLVRRSQIKDVLGAYLRSTSSSQPVDERPSIAAFDYRT
jgi:hypothetical protein